MGYKIGMNIKKKYLLKRNRFGIYVKFNNFIFSESEAMTDCLKNESGGNGM